jgi:LuxR family maltose regulon positive regulatory protein
LGDYLRRLREHLEAIHNTRFLIEVLALESLYFNSLGDEEAAFTALQRSLSLAQPGGFIRLYVDLGPRMKMLLGRFSNNGKVTDYKARILAAFPVSRPANRPLPHPAQEAMIEPLTLRERQVLELLSRRLTNKEIAHTLVISPVTVKRHTINIYQKLYVQNRRDAVLTAQNLGILE